MTLSPYMIALLGTIVAGYTIAVGLGTIAYFSNEKNY